MSMPYSTSSARSGKEASGKVEAERASGVSDYFAVLVTVEATAEGALKGDGEAGAADAARQYGAADPTAEAEAGVELGAAAGAEVGAEASDASAAADDRNRTRTSPKAAPAEKGRFMRQGTAAWALPLGAGLALAAIWQAGLIHAVLGLAAYQLPLPSAIFRAAADNAGLLFRSAGYTLLEAAAGIAAGTLLGWLAAAMAAAMPRWGSGALLLAASLGAVPIVALAPIMNLWLGDGLASRAAVAAAATLAPMAIGSYRGLTSADSASMDLMNVLGAGAVPAFFKLRLPSSLPAMLTAFKISTAGGLIAAMVSEFFYSSRGLGYLLSNSVKIARMPLGWACIGAAAAAGIGMYMLVQAAERRLLLWHPEFRRRRS